MYVTFAALAVATTLYIIGKVIYLAFFHPLAKYPGPFLARFSHAYASYHAWKGDIHIDMWRCHQKYGNFVRYGPKQLLVNTPEGIKDIYGIKSSSHFLKSSHYDVLSHHTANTFTHRGGKDHLRRRRTVAQGVSTQALNDYEPRIATHIGKLCDTVFPDEEQKWSEPFNMSKWSNYLSFDMMADIIFGAKYNLLGEERFRYVPEMIEKSNVRVSAIVQFPGLSWLKLDRHFFKEAVWARNRFLNFVMRLVRDRMELSKGNVTGIFEKSVNEITSAAKSRDVYSRLEQTTDPVTGESFGHEELASESITLVVAGADTTACTIASTLFYLANNPECYDKVAKEIRSTVTRKEQLTSVDLSTCIYLRACIDEALRMSPAVGAALVREVTRSTGTTVDGEFIPAGVDIGTGTYAVHHNSDSFPDSFTYKPERWLKEYTSQDSIDKARSAFVPFSIGMRSCLGKSLAYAEITLVIATMLFTGDFKFAEGDLGRAGRGQKDAAYGRHRENEYQLRDHIAGQKEGPYLQFSRRQCV